MNSSLLASIFPLLAQQGQRQPGMGDLFVPMILMFVIFYFLLIRPQRQKQKKVQEQISAMKKDDKVVTIGGMHGLVTNVKDRTVILKLADNVKVEFEKTAVASVIAKDAGGGDESQDSPPSER